MATSLFFSCTQSRSQILGICFFIAFSFIASPLQAQDDNVGIDQPNPQEKLDVNGAIRIGTTANDNEGTIRYENGDFEGRTPNGWESFTQGGGGVSLWSQLNNAMYNGYNSAIINSDPGDVFPLYHLTINRGSSGILFDDNDLLRGYYFANENAPGFEMGGMLYKQDTSNLRLFNKFGKLTFSTSTDGNFPTERMVIQETGNVGIGTSLPEASLEVVDLVSDKPLRLTGSFSSLMQLKTESGFATNWQVGGNGNYFDIMSNPENDFSGVNNFLLSIDASNSYVGINNSGPVERLDVNGAIKIGTTVNNFAGTIRYENDVFEGRTTNGWTSLQGYWTKSGTDLYYENGLMVNSAPGAATPLYDFNINEGNAGILLDDNDALRGYYFANENAAGFELGGLSYLQNDDELKLSNKFGDLTFATGTAGNFPPTQVTIKDNGRMGIGTTNPIRHLDINDADDPDKTVVRLTHDEENRIEFKNAAPGYTDWTLLATDGFFGLASATEPLFFNDYKFSVLENGDVGIGQVLPIYKLEVNGDAGKPGGGFWTAVSDRRLKTDINPYQDGLSSILKIKPVTFRYNGKHNLPTDKEYVGIIAQEMQQIAPYTVTEKTHKSHENPEKEEKFLTFDGSALTFMLINAVQEQQAQIEKLEQRLAELEGKK